jgi:hypothetical protein
MCLHYAVVGDVIRDYSARGDHRTRADTQLWFDEDPGAKPNTIAHLDPISTPGPKLQ